MDRATFDQLIAQEVADALSQLTPGRISEVRARAILDVLAKRVETYSRDYYLSGLRTVDDLAAEFGVSARRIRAIAANRHERFGVGMRVGNTWLWSPDEIERMRPDEKYRRAE